MKEKHLFAPAIVGGADRAFCGPTAVVGITGASFENVYKKIRRIRKKNHRQIRAFRENRFGDYVDDGRLLPIKGTGTHEVLETLRMLGKIVKEKGDGRIDGRSYKGWDTSQMTLGDFCRDRGHMGPFLVEVTGHWIALGWGHIVCSQYHFKDGPVPWQSYRSLKRKVWRWYQFK